MVLYSKNIILEEETFDGYLELEGGRIKALHKEYQGPYEDFSEQVILPGFIDIHVHGWATGSFWFEKTPLAVREMCRTLPFAGVTSFLATSGADFVEEIQKCILAADTVYEEQQGLVAGGEASALAGGETLASAGGGISALAGAELLGVHLEGPFINPQYRGMQREECCLAPDVKVMEALYAAFRNKELCRHMTIAVEREGAREVLGFCREHGIQTAIGHSGATFAEIAAIKDAGIGGVTHTFSGMRGFHHRELGVAGAALYFDDLMCEFAKQTGMTVAHEAFDIAYRIKGSGRIILTTDCSGLAQTQTEFDHYIRKIRFVRDGERVRLEHYDGRVEWINPRDYKAVRELELGYAASVRNMARHTKVDWHDIMRMTSRNPARYIHVDDRKGSIKPGMDADLTILDADWNLVCVFCRGREIRE